MATSLKDLGQKQLSRTFERILFHSNSAHCWLEKCFGMFRVSLQCLLSLMSPMSIFVEVVYVGH